MEISSWPERGFENPVELALAGIEALANNSDANDILYELDAIGTIFGLHRRYFVESRRAFAIPFDCSEQQTVEVTDFSDGLTFSGHLASFAALHIRGLGRQDGENISALCLTFHSLLHLPSFKSLDKSQFLHVPAYAVEDIRPEQ